MASNRTPKPRFEPWISLLNLPIPKIKVEEGVDIDGPSDYEVTQTPPTRKRLSTGTVFTPNLIRGAAGLADSHPITYRVLPPGGGPIDPRRGYSQKSKDLFYHCANLGNPDNDNPADFAYEDEPPTPYFITNPNVIPDVISTGYFDKSVPIHISSPSSPTSDRAAYIERTRIKVNRDVLNEAKVLRKMDCTCAEEAVKFYNQIHGTRYQIVETLGSNSKRYWGDLWFHCNFRAVEFQHGHPSTYPKLFAELFLEHHLMYATDCFILDDPNLEIVHGCEMCGDLLAHPANLHQVGN